MGKRQQTLWLCDIFDGLENQFHLHYSYENVMKTFQLTFISYFSSDSITVEISYGCYLLKYLRAINVKRLK